MKRKRDIWHEPMLWTAILTVNRLAGRTDSSATIRKRIVDQIAKGNVRQFYPRGPYQLRKKWRK